MKYKMKSFFCLFMVFMAGLVAGIQATGLRYGFPEHYNGGWHKYVFACILGVFFSYIAYENIKKGRC